MRRLVQLLALVWLLGVLSGRAEAAAHVLQVQDAIGPASADYVVRGLKKAQEQGAGVVVLQLDTPGGLDSSMRQIIQAILSSPVPVITYVSPEGARAASAGTYILYASHVAAMAPGTTLGAATPVALGMPAGGGDGKPAGGASAPSDAMTAKQVNDAAALIRGLAQQRGRNAEWAERAVREAVSLTAQEALQQRVVDLVARNVADLLAQADGRKVGLAGGAERVLQTKGLPLQHIEPGWRHRLLSVIANPSLALILMMIGLYGLMFEFSSPGWGVPGIVGAICLLLALFALQVLPVNYAGMALLLVGLALMAAEAVTPTFGVLGVGGIVAFVAGGILLFDSDVPGYGVPLPLLVGMATASALLIVLAGRMVLLARRRRAVSGQEEMVGSLGDVLPDDGTPGESWALVHGERWRVRPAAGTTMPLRAGQRVRVRALDGLTLEVEPVADLDTPRKGMTP